jgi:hypothetical protein
MNNAFNKLREIRWQRKLTAAEEAELSAEFAKNPALRAAWNEDLVLSRGLEKLPDAPMPSNFTARVMQAIEAENHAAARSRRFNWKWAIHSLLPKAAFATLAICAGLISYHEGREVKRAQLARSVAAVSQVASLPSPEILKDFDAIQQLNTAPPPDAELLALLQ